MGAFLSLGIVDSLSLPVRFSFILGVWGCQHLHTVPGIVILVKINEASQGKTEVDEGGPVEPPGTGPRLKCLIPLFYLVLLFYLNHSSNENYVPFKGRIQGISKPRDLLHAIGNKLLALIKQRTSLFHSTSA